VVSIATSKPSDHGCAATRWSLDDIAAAILNQAHAEAMSRSTIFRVLDDADLKPHKSVYWLNSHDPDFQTKAREICQLYVNAPRLYEQGRLVICSDEKTGMQILERKYPTHPAAPGKPERREQEYIRHGTRVLTASFVVPTGEVVWEIGQTRTSEDFAAHVVNVAEHFPDFQGFDWVLDNLNTHWSLEVCEEVAKLSKVAFVPRELKTGTQRRAFLTDPSHKHVFHFTPKHGSWVNQVELWFSILARRFLQRGDFCSPEVFEQLLRRFLDDYNACHAHPFRWTYTGQPLVRDTPFSRTRRQQKRGRAWFSPRPQLFERLLYLPRPYHHIAV
jgi:transposase